MDRANISELTYCMRKTGYSETDIHYILTVYNFYREKQSSMSPEQLEKQCVHLIYTARELAEQTLHINTIAAALTHDLLYTCESINAEQLKPTFSDTVVQYLKDMKRFHEDTIKYLNGKVQRSAQDLLKIPVNPHVVLIAAAKRIDRLNRISLMKQDERPYYLDNTNDLLIKLVDIEGSIYFSDQLSESMLRCKKPIIFTDYEEKYELLLKSNKSASEDTLDFLSNTFTGNGIDLSSDIVEHTKYIKSMQVSKRRIHNIYKHIKADEDKGIGQPFSKWNVPLYDILLIFDDSLFSRNGSVRSLTDEFMSIFKLYLKTHKFTIREYLITARDSVPYFVLADRWENRYRVFLRTELLYRRYKVGIIGDEELRSSDFPNQTTYNGTVRILIDQNEYFLPAGYSSLDYAFWLKSTQALNFLRMEIQPSSTDLLGNKILYDGAVGKLILDKQVTADFTWFNYIKSEQARKHLIEYFKSNYKKNP